MSLMRRCSIIVAAGLLLVLAPAARAQLPDRPPFSLPFQEPAGPTTWLYEQHFGNTTAAFNYGDVWYLYGQGLHFGLDMDAPCGTPVQAIADGVVVVVDAEGFGAGPHNLIMEHPGTGYTSLYGHLLELSELRKGDEVTRGQQIGLSGDPDGNCESRPHLHLEVRSPDYLTSYNPLPLFDVNWHMLASVGPHTHGFQQDLDTPRRWMKLEDQPDVKMSGPIVNNYERPWPPRLERRAPVDTAAARDLDPLPEAVEVRRTEVSTDTWNIGAWWNPRDTQAVYVIDTVPGQPTGVFRQPLDGTMRQYAEPAPPTLFSPDGTVTVRRRDNGLMRITRLKDGAIWDVDTDGNYPAVSPDGTRLLWEVVYGDSVPGTSTPAVAMFVSNLDGSVVRRVHSQSGGYSLWLDPHRLLLVKRPPFTAETELYILDIDDPAVTPRELGVYANLYDLKVAPGGGMIAFLLPFQEDPESSGIYVQRTVIGSAPKKLPFFGAYEWRDADSLFTLSFDQDADVHALGYADAVTGEHRWLTDPADLPIRVANGDWSVSPDGTRIVYVDPADYGLYMLAVEAE